MNGTGLLLGVNAAPAALKAPLGWGRLWWLLLLAGALSPAYGQDDRAAPVLYGILMEDRASDGARYRLATAEEWRWVRVMRRGVRLSATPDMRLKTGDRIGTDSRVAVAIRFPGGSRLYVKPDSLIEIGSVFAFFGELFVRVKGAFQVDTEFVTAGAEGTEWVMTVLRDGDTRCTVLEGRVRMVSKKNYWDPLSMIPGQQQATSDLRGAALNPAPQAELNEMRGWIAQMDRLLEESRAPAAEGGYERRLGPRTPVLEGRRERPAPQGSRTPAGDGRRERPEFPPVHFYFERYPHPDGPARPKLEPRSPGRGSPGSDG